MLTPEILDDLQIAFDAALASGTDYTAAIELALTSCAPIALKTALDNERDRRKQEAYLIRHVIFSSRPKDEDIQDLISYLARWHTSFTLPRIARITGYGTSAMQDEIRKWMAANPGRLTYDEFDQLYRTPRAARRVAAKAAERQSA